MTIPATVFVVLLHDLMVRGDQIHEGTVLEVDRPIRNDWTGSMLCRDATDDEIAQYKSEAGGDADDPSASLEAAQAQLKALESQRDQAQEELDELTAEVDALVKQKGELADEVAALEAKKAKAAAK